MNEMKIRMATIEDANSILEIYEPYILNTPITFEYDKVAITEFEERIRSIQKRYPYLVCTIDDFVVGYAYCSSHRERAGFKWDCECSVYLREGYGGKGIASSLYEALFAFMYKLGYYNIYALICVPNDSSIALHKKFGFHEIGIYVNTAYKLGKWRDLLIMVKELRDFISPVAPPLSVHDLDGEYITQILETVTKKIKSCISIG